jgi:hypothetical protein
MSLDIRPNPSASAGGITGGLVYKGSYNATTNTPDLTSSDKGDLTKEISILSQLVEL